MEKPELIKRGIYKKVALCTSPNAKKSKLQNVQEKIGKLKEIRSSEKIFNRDGLKPSLRKSMLIRAVQSTEKEIKQNEKHIISSTPHHTKNHNQNGQQPFFGKDFSVLLSPIVLGRLSNNQEVEEKNTPQSDSSSELMSPKEKNKTMIGSPSPERLVLSVKELDANNDCNKQQISIRKSKRDQSTNRSKITQDLATEINKSLAEKPTDKSPEKRAKKSPLKVSSAQQGGMPKSRIPLRLPSQEKNEIHKPRKRILSRSVTETPKKHDLSTNNQDVRDEDKKEKPRCKETKRSVSLSPKNVGGRKENVRNQLTFEQETEANVSKNLRPSKIVEKATDKDEGNKTITQNHNVVTRSGSRRVQQQELDGVTKTSYIHNQQDNVRKYRGSSHSRENEFVNMTPRKKNNDTLVLQGLDDPDDKDSDKNASVILVVEEASRCEKTHLGNKSRPSALRCQPVNGRSSVFAKSIGLSPIIVQTDRRDTTILHNTAKEKTVQFHHNSPFAKSNVNTSNSYNNLDKPTEACALIITDNLSHKILPEKGTDITAPNQSNRTREENSPKKKTGDEKNKGDDSAKTNDAEKVTEDVISETDAKSKELDTSQESERSDPENIIENHKRNNLNSARENNDAIEIHDSIEVQEDNNGRNKQVEENNLNSAGKTDDNRNVHHAEAVNNTEINDNSHNTKENEVANYKSKQLSFLRARIKSISESINALNKSGKGSGPLNAAATNDVGADSRDENKATNTEQDAMSVLCSEISAKRRGTGESIDTINGRSDDNDSGKREMRRSSRVRRTVNREIQTSVGFARGKMRLLSSRYIEQTTQTSQNSRVIDSSESYPLISFCTDQSSNGAGSEIIKRTMNAPCLVSHNIFESLQEGPELDEWSESDDSGCRFFHHTLSTQPWRFVNDNLVPEQSSNVTLNFIRSENAMRLRSSANDELDYASDNSDALTVDNMVSEFCKAPTTKSSRNTTAAFRFDVDTMLSRTERRQYKKRNGKEVSLPKKSLSDDTIVSKASKNAQRSPSNTPKTPTKHSVQANKYRKSKSSQRTSPPSKGKNTKPTDRYIPQPINAENTLQPINRNRNRGNVISLSPADQQLLGVRPILASESETNNSDSSHRPTDEGKGRFTRGNKLFLNKHNRANSVANSSVNDVQQNEKELETDSLGSTEEDRDRFTRGKQLHSNKNQNRAKSLKNSNVKVVQQDDEESETDSVESRKVNTKEDRDRVTRGKQSYSNKNRANSVANSSVNDVQQNEKELETDSLGSTEEDRDRFTRGKQLHSNKNQNWAKSLKKSNVKVVQQDDEESEIDSVESRNVNTEEDRDRVTRGKQSYSNKNRANSVANLSVNDVQQNEKELETDSLGSMEEDRDRFTRGQQLHSNKNQNRAKSLKNSNVKDVQQDHEESETDGVESRNVNTEEDRDRVTRGKQSYSSKNRANSVANSNVNDVQQNEEELETDSLGSTEEDRDRFTRGKLLHSNKNQDRAKSLKKSNVNDVQQDDEESEIDSVESRNVNTEEDRDRFTRGKLLHSNKNQDRAKSLKKSNVNDVQQDGEESEIDSVESRNVNTEEDRDRVTRGKQSYSNKNRAKSVENSNVKDAQQDDEESETDSLAFRNVHTERDRDRVTRGKQSYSNKNQNGGKSVENSNIKDVQQDNEESENYSLENTEEDKDRFTRGQQSYSNQNRGKSVENSNVNDVQQNHEELETDRLESRNINTKEDRHRFSKSKQSYSNQNRAKSVENSNVNDVQQNENESEAESSLNKNDRGGLTRGKQSYSNKNKNRADAEKSSNKADAQQNEKESDESKDPNTEKDRSRVTKGKQLNSNKNQKRIDTVENSNINNVQQNEKDLETDNLESSNLNKKDRGRLSRGKQSNKNKSRTATEESSNKADVQENNIAISNSDNIDKESNHLPATSSAPSKTVKSAGRSKRTKKQNENAIPSVQLDESNNNQILGGGRPQRTRKPVRYLTDLKLNEYELVGKRKEKTTGRTAKSGNSNKTTKETVEVKEKPKRKARTKKQKKVETQEADVANENLDVVAVGDHIQIHELPDRENDVVVPSLHNSVDDNQPPIEPLVNNESAVSPRIRIRTDLTIDSGLETINGINNRTTKRNNLSKAEVGGKKRHIETEQNEDNNKEPATESTEISNNKSGRSGESNKKLSVKGKSNKKDKNRKTIETQDTDKPNEILTNYTENDFDKISAIPVTSQDQEDALPSPRSSLDENRPSIESRLGDPPVTEIECMPPPNGCSTIHSFGAPRIRRHLSGDSGFETLSGIDKPPTTKRKCSTRIRSTAKKRQAESKQRDGGGDVSGGDNQPDDDEVPQTADFVPAEHNTDGSLFQFPTSTIQRGVSKTHRKQNVAKDVTDRVSRALERASESFRTLDQTAFSHRGSETRNNGSRRITGFSEPVSNDYLNYDLNGQLYHIKYANQLPLDCEYRRIGDIEMTQTLKFPKNDITAGYLRIQPGERKKAAYTNKHSFVYTLIKGSAIIQVENRTSTLQAGSFFFVPVGSQYSIRNIDLQSQLILSYLRTAAV